MERIEIRGWQEPDQPSERRQEPAAQAGRMGHGERRPRIIHRSGRAEAIEYTEIAPEASTTRNKRSVWTVPPQPFKEAHFATFPRI